MERLDQPRSQGLSSSSCGKTKDPGDEVAIRRVMVALRAFRFFKRLLIVGKLQVKKMQEWFERGLVLVG